MAIMNVIHSYLAKSDLVLYLENGDGLECSRYEFDISP